MKRSFFSTLFFFLFFLSVHTADASLKKAVPASGNRVSFVVGKEMVSLYELRQRLRLSAFSSGFQDTPQHLKLLLPNVLRMMIDELIQIQAAEAVDISISDQEIKEGIGELEVVNKMPKGHIRKFLAANHIPFKVLERQIRANLSWVKYIRALYQGAVRISEENIRQYVERYNRERQESRYRIGEIVLYVDDPKRETKVRQDITELARMLQAGASFPSVAYQFSQAPSRQQGGDLGWVTLKDLDPSLVQALERTQVGQFSGPWRTASGYSLIALIQKEGPSSCASPSLSPEGAERILRGERLELLARTELSKLRRRAVVKILHTLI